MENTQGGGAGEGGAGRYKKNMKKKGVKCDNFMYTWSVEKEVKREENGKKKEDFFFFCFSFLNLEYIWTIKLIWTAVYLECYICTSG